MEMTVCQSQAGYVDFLFGTRKRTANIPEDCSEADSLILISAEQYMIESILSSQMLRLHAPYCGYSDTKHAFSNEACLSAADSVLDSNLHLVQMQVADRFWVSYLATPACLA